MGPIKIFVGNVPRQANKDDLKDLFEKYGRVTECDILHDFAFVHMRYTTDGEAAISSLDGTSWKGSRLRVEVSTTRSKGEGRRRRRLVCIFVSTLLIYLYKFYVN